MGGRTVRLACVAAALAGLLAVATAQANEVAGEIDFNEVAGEIDLAEVAALVDVDGDVALDAANDEVAHVAAPSGPVNLVVALDFGTVGVSYGLSVRAPQTGATTDARLTDALAGLKVYSPGIPGPASAKTENVLLYELAADGKTVRWRLERSPMLRASACLGGSCAPPRSSCGLHSAASPRAHRSASHRPLCSPAPYFSARSSSGRPPARTPMSGMPTPRQVQAACPRAAAPLPLLCRRGCRRRLAPASPCPSFPPRPPCTLAL